MQDSISLEQTVLLIPPGFSLPSSFWTFCLVMVDTRLILELQRTCYLSPGSSRRLNKSRRRSFPSAMEGEKHNINPPSWQTMDQWKLEHLS
jgi:hypothetical protein